MLDIQIYVINVCVVEMINVIIKNDDNRLFSIPVDEFRQVSTKEQMSSALHFVNFMSLTRFQYFDCLTKSCN